MSETERQYGWVWAYGIPILYYDPMPSLGPYFNARAMIGATPRPVRWWPPNWVILPVVSLISLAILTYKIIRGEA